MGCIVLIVVGNARAYFGASSRYFGKNSTDEVSGEASRRASSWSTAFPTLRLVPAPADMHPYRMSSYTLIERHPMTMMQRQRQFIIWVLCPWEVGGKPFL